VARGQILFSTHPKTITARNLRAHPALVVHLESGDQVVIVEGTAIQLDDPRYSHDSVRHAKPSTTGL